MKLKFWCGNEEKRSMIQIGLFVFNSLFFVCFSKTFDLSDENLLCITLTMHAKILLADSNIAPSITKRAKLFVLFCVVPHSFTVGLHTLRFFSGAKKTYNQLEFSVLTNKSSWEKELFYSTVFLRLVHLCFSEFSRNKIKVILTDLTC